MYTHNIILNVHDYRFTANVDAMYINYILDCFKRVRVICGNEKKKKIFIYILTFYIILYKYRVFCEESVKHFK